jgi:hypothetical protein
MYDLLIQNGLVVDGSGAPGRRADVGISDGKILSIEDRISGQAARTLDASDLVVAPGLHRPAHALRRADLLGRAPHALVLARRHLGGDGQLRRRHRALPPEAREIAMRDLVNVEAIPFEVLAAASPGTGRASRSTCRPRRGASPRSTSRSSRRSRRSGTT